MPVSDDERLRSAGLRVTRPRLAVLDVVRTGDHLDADAVSRLARARVGRLSRQAVYDILQALTGAGLLRRLYVTAGAARYELRAADHHHLVCRICGAVVDVGLADGGGPCPATAPADFLVEDTAITFRGRCPNCRTDADPPRRPGPHDRPDQHREHRSDPEHRSDRQHRHGGDR